MGLLVHKPHGQSLFDRESVERCAQVKKRAQIARGMGSPPRVAEFEFEVVAITLRNLSLHHEQFKRGAKTPCLT